MARYDVDIRVRPGEHVRRKVRAGCAPAAYERVMREHIEHGGAWSMELAIVPRRGLRRQSTVFSGRPGQSGDDGGLAGVREPRRPKPSPPGLRTARDES